MPDKREDLGQLFGRISRLPEPKSLRDLSTTLNITDFFLVSAATVGLGCDCCATLTVDRCCEQWQMTTVLNMNIDTGSHNCKMVMLSRFAVLCVSLTWKVSLLQTTYTAQRSTASRSRRMSCGE